VSPRFDRNDLERLRDAKRSRNFYRLRSSQAVEYEFRGQFGHPSSYAFVRFECAPADDLSFQVRASWPTTVSEGDRTHVELGIAEGVADMLLEGVYQHSGCAVVLVDVRWDDVGSSVAAFMRATKSAMQQLVAGDWEIVLRSEKQSAPKVRLT
jgi:hypothetical protein